MTASLDRDLSAVAEADAALAGGGPVPVALGARAAQVVGALRGIEDTDWWLPGLRDRAGAVLREVPLDRLRDGLLGARPYRVVPPGGSPALRALVAVGLARAGEASACVHLGPGSVADGAFSEALDLAARFAAPVIFVVDQPDLTGAPVPRPAMADVAALAAAYGVPCTAVPASDAAAVRDAVAAARAAGGPHVVVAAA